MQGRGVEADDESISEQAYGTEGLCLVGDMDALDDGAELPRSDSGDCGQPGCECCALQCSNSFGGSVGLAMVSCPKMIRTHCKICRIHQVREPLEKKIKNACPYAMPTVAKESLYLTMRYGCRSTR